VHSASIGTAFYESFSKGALELCGVDKNPVLIAGHLEPGRAFFHQMAIRLF
jgi:hypothetical protein